MVLGHDCAFYQMALSEFVELQKQLDELIDAWGCIKLSKTPYCAHVLFQRKHDSSMKMVDDKALKKVTIKYKYLVPNATDMFDHFSKASVYTKLDFRFGYWQVPVASGDE